MSEFQLRTTSRPWRTVNLGAVVAEAEEMVSKKDNSAELLRSFPRIRFSLQPSRPLASTARYVTGVTILVLYVRRQLHVG